MSTANGVNRPPEARVIEVIEVEFRRGAGVDKDPVRLVRAYYDKDGTVLAESDPWWDAEAER